MPVSANGQAPSPVTLPELRVSRAAALLLGLADGDTHTLSCPPGECGYAGPFRVKVVEALCVGCPVSPPPPGPPPGPPPAKVAAARRAGEGV
jgi:hypothetical protein